MHFPEKKSRTKVKGTVSSSNGTCTVEWIARHVLMPIFRPRMIQRFFIFKKKNPRIKSHLLIFLVNLKLFLQRPLLSTRYDDAPDQSSEIIINLSQATKSINNLPLAKYSQS